jgi:hypothetical protein
MDTGKPIWIDAEKTNGNTGDAIVNCEGYPSIAFMQAA